MDSKAQLSVKVQLYKTYCAVGPKIIAPFILAVIFRPMQFKQHTVILSDKNWCILCPFNFETVNWETCYSVNYRDFHNFRNLAEPCIGKTLVTLASEKTGRQNQQAWINTSLYCYSQISSQSWENLQMQCKKCLFSYSM